MDLVLWSGNEMVHKMDHLEKVAEAKYGAAGLAKKRAQRKIEATRKSTPEKGIGSPKGRCGHLDQQQPQYHQ